jgi:hypothetical protein
MQTTKLPDGGAIHRNPKTGETLGTDPRGHINSYEKPGVKATDFRADGHAAHIERTRPDGSRMLVNRGVRGDRRIEVVRPGGVRVVAYGRRGFVERPFRRGYVSRTYVIGGKRSVYVYRNYSYRGFAYYRYVPRVYYAPAFYGWAYRPWGVRVAYAWGWGPAPGWFYGGYFAPSPYYADPAAWLTDYLLAKNLQLAAESQQAPNAEQAQASGAAMTPDQMQAMKQTVANEVRQQIQAEHAAAVDSNHQQTVSDAANQGPDTGPPPEAAPPALDPNQRTFVVSASLDVTAVVSASLDATATGESCTLTGGDILYRRGDVQDDGKIVVTVLSSKPGDCRANSDTSVELAALQEMQNQFREQIASGMETLATKQGQGGIPSGPAANPTQVAEGQAPPALDAQTVLTQLNTEADQTEKDINQATSGATPSAMLQPSVFRDCGRPLPPYRDSGPPRVQQPCLPPRVFRGCAQAGICS